MNPEREFFLHLLARCFLFKSRIWKSPYEHYWFLDGSRIFDDLCEWYDCEAKAEYSNPPAAGQRLKIIHRPDVFFSRLWELKPFDIFHCLEDEDYADQIVSWAKLLKTVEMLTKEEQEFVLTQIIKYGNRKNYFNNPAALYQLQQPEHSSQMPTEIGNGEDGRGS